MAGITAGTRNTPPVQAKIECDTTLPIPAIEDADPESLQNTTEDQEPPACVVSLPYLDKILLPGPSKAMLEAGVQAAIRLAESFLPPLQDAKDNQETPTFIQSIEALKTQAKPERPIVGVLGHTGAGKSSLINSVVGVENILATSCMRACTAVISELRYNESNDPNERYRADIEYISVDDWKQELSYIWGDLVDPEGNLAADHASHDSDAGVAYAKVKAVYPKLIRNKETVTQYSVETLLKDPDVMAILGTTKKIATSTEYSFKDELQEYLDGREKPRASRPTRQIALWPLIKVVRIYLRTSEVLKNITLVDMVNLSLSLSALKPLPSV